jgi:hypothetical protein
MPLSREFLGDAPATIENLLLFFAMTLSSPFGAGGKSSGHAAKL